MTCQHCACFFPYLDVRERPLYDYECGFAAPEDSAYRINRQQGERKSRETISDLQPTECIQIGGDPGEQEE